MLSQLVENKCEESGKVTGKASSSEAGREILGDKHEKNESSGSFDTCYKLMDGTLNANSGQDSFVANKEMYTESTEHKDNQDTECRLTSCQYCNKIFPCSFVKLHERSCNAGNTKYPTSGMLQETETKCHLCKNFFPDSLLEQHIQTCSGRKVHECSECHRVFQMPSKLLIHLQSHSDERRHVCKLCEKPFKFKSGLNRHIRQRHRDEQKSALHEELQGLEYNLLRDEERYRTTEAVGKERNPDWSEFDVDKRDLRTSGTDVRDLENDGSERVDEQYNVPVNKNRHRLDNDNDYFKQGKEGIERSDLRKSLRDENEVSGRVENVDDGEKNVSMAVDEEKRNELEDFGADDDENLVKRNRNLEYKERNDMREGVVDGGSNANMMFSEGRDRQKIMAVLNESGHDNANKSKKSGVHDALDQEQKIPSMVFDDKLEGEKPLRPNVEGRSDDMNERNKAYNYEEKVQKDTQLEKKDFSLVCHQRKENEKHLYARNCSISNECPKGEVSTCKDDDKLLKGRRSEGNNFETDEESLVEDPSELCEDENVFEVNSQSCELSSEGFSNPLLPVKTPASKIRNTYQCDVCEKAFSKPSSLTKHKQTHTNDRPFACEFCSKFFKYKGSWSRHIKEQHYGMGRKTKIELDENQLKEISGQNYVDTQIYKCPHCPRLFEKLSRLFVHKRSHNDEINIENFGTVVKEVDGTTGSGDTNLKRGSFEASMACFEKRENESSSSMDNLESNGIEHDDNSSAEGKLRRDNIALTERNVNRLHDGGINNAKTKLAEANIYASEEDQLDNCLSRDELLLKEIDEKERRARLAMSHINYDTTLLEYFCNLCGKHMKHKASLIRHVKEQHYGLGRKSLNRVVNEKPEELNTCSSNAIEKIQSRVGSCGATLSDYKVDYVRDRNIIPSDDINSSCLTLSKNDHQNRVSHFGNILNKSNIEELHSTEETFTEVSSYEGEKDRPEKENFNKGDNIVRETTDLFDVQENRPQTYFVIPDDNSNRHECCSEKVTQEVDEGGKQERDFNPVMINCEKREKFVEQVNNQLSIDSGIKEENFGRRGISQIKERNMDNNDESNSTRQSDMTERVDYDEKRSGRDDVFEDVKLKEQNSENKREILAFFDIKVDDSPEYCCNLCGRYMKHKTSLIRHVKEQHYGLGRKSFMRMFGEDPEEVNSSSLKALESFQGSNFDGQFTDRNSILRQGNDGSCLSLTKQSFQNSERNFERNVNKSDYESRFHDDETFTKRRSEMKDSVDGEQNLSEKENKNEPNVEKQNMDTTQSDSLQHCNTTIIKYGSNFARIRDNLNTNEYSSKHVPHETEQERERFDNRRSNFDGDRVDFAAVVKNDHPITRESCDSGMNGERSELVQRHVDGMQNNFDDEQIGFPSMVQCKHRITQKDSNSEMNERSSKRILHEFDGEERQFESAQGNLVGEQNNLEILMQKQSDSSQENAPGEFGCSVCGKYFKYKRTFNRHVKEQHYGLGRKSLSNWSDVGSSPKQFDQSGLCKSEAAFYDKNENTDKNSDETGGCESSCLSLEKVPDKDKKDSGKVEGEHFSPGVKEVNKMNENTDNPVVNELHCFNQDDADFYHKQQETEQKDKKSDTKENIVAARKGKLSKPCKEAKEFECEECSKVFPNRSQLRKHQRIHSDGMSFFCEICQQTFKYKASVNRHVKEQHYGLGRKIYRRMFNEQLGKDGLFSSKKICHFSNEVGRENTDPKEENLKEENQQKDGNFEIRDANVVHQVSFEGEKSQPQKEQCDFDIKHESNATFEEYSLKYWEKKRVYRCSSCPRTFSNTSQLREHTYKHMNAKTFPCKPCGKAFKFRSGLVRHNRKEHASHLRERDIDFETTVDERLAMEKSSSNLEIEDCSLGNNEQNTRFDKYVRRKRQFREGEESVQSTYGEYSTANEGCSDEARNSKIRREDQGDGFGTFPGENSRTKESRCTLISESNPVVDYFRGDVAVKLSTQGVRANIAVKKKTPLYKCNKCDEMFKELCDFLTHQRIHK